MRLLVISLAMVSLFPIFADAQSASESRQSKWMTAQTSCNVAMRQNCVADADGCYNARCPNVGSNIQALNQCRAQCAQAQAACLKHAGC
jgi:hypothetical protein